MLGGQGVSASLAAAIVTRPPRALLILVPATMRMCQYPACHRFILDAGIHVALARRCSRSDLQELYDG